ncbi:signal peptide peptidase SppA, 67K type [SAR86 cluster bacterium SAR86E]|jgi:protease-4|uniref:Signal peptide peptidase SppA, 67K type n=1 Tax=SAR86 cluster bacterium SAR86E TaxID=1208365 RepID=K6GIV4_9GAMM|nr:signal peptide peptidase SppA, 67K type [SAR86 cluster bacterium SAR86E]
MSTLKSIFSWLGRFLERARTVMLNLGTAFVLIFLTIIIIGAFTASGPDAKDPSGRVLILDPQGIVVDEEVFSDDFLASITNDESDQIQTRDLIELIQNIAADDEIPAVLIDFSGTGFAGPTTALNIAKELKALKDSGKRVIAFGDRMTTSSYLMASQASEIWIHPVGSISIAGLGGMRQYNKELYENLKINFNNYSQGDFKSAVEGNTRTNMSENDRLQRTAILEPIWNEYKSLMSESRGITAEEIQYFADNYIGFFGEAAMMNIEFATSKNIINGTKSFPEFRQYMIENFGEDEDADTTTYKYISYQEYADQLEKDLEEDSENEIAVITAEGVIMEGEIAPGVAGANGIVKQIRKAHENENTKAIVFRVNSPGGSIIASEMMRDELFAAKRKGLKVVVSMGDYAASGGVYISTPADYIFAEPTTITGSIGVAIALPTLENAMDYIGVNFDGVVTSKYAGWDPLQKIDDDLDKIFESWGAGAYDRFITFVSDSRSQPYEDIKSIAGGRVWIGSAAQELGLVDELGDIDDAINYAVQMADLEDYQVEYYGQELSPEEIIIKELLDSFDVSIKEPEVLTALSGLSKLYSEYTDLKQPKALIACENCLVDID